MESQENYFALPDLNKSSEDLTQKQRFEQIQKQRKEFFTNITTLDHLITKRKDKILESQQLKRKKLIEEKRQLVQKLQDSEEQEDLPKQNQINPFESHFKMEVDGVSQEFIYQKEEKGDKIKKVRALFARQLQIYDFLLPETLSQLQSDHYMIYARPEGERCLVTSCKGRTIARNTQGYVIATFESYLPNGKAKENVHQQQAKTYTHYTNKNHSAALDCIYSDQQKTFYILDIIHWEDMIYADYPFCSRFMFLQQKIQILQAQNWDDQAFNFRLVEYQNLSPTNLINCYFGKQLSSFINIQENEFGYSLEIQNEKIQEELKIGKTLYSKYRSILAYIEMNNLLELDQLKIWNDLDYIISLFAKFHIYEKGDLYFKDGVIFTHIESLYNSGVNDMILHWRDVNTSIYNQKMNQLGVVDVIVRLNENFEFTTLDDDIFIITDSHKKDRELEILKIDQLYQLQIKLESDFLQVENPSTEPITLQILDFKVLKKSNKVNADHTSKIISKFLDMYNQNVTLQQILNQLFFCMKEHQVQELSREASVEMKDI